jgi:hypothetical protein
MEVIGELSETDLTYLGVANAETRAPLGPIAELQLGQPLPGLEAV